MSELASTEAESNVFDDTANNNPNNYNDNDLNLNDNNDNSINPNENITDNNIAGPTSDEANNLDDSTQRHENVRNEQHPTEANQTENNLTLQHQEHDRPEEEPRIQNEHSPQDREFDQSSLPEEEQDGEVLGLPVPPSGTELFLGGLSRDIREEDIRRAFSLSGKIFSIRVVRDRATGDCRGFGFITFVTREAAKQAVRDHHEKTEIKSRVVRVTVSESKSRLFLGSMPRDMQRTELEAILTEDGSVIRSLEWLPDAYNPKRNRGFAFVEFVSHQDATQVLKRFQRTSLHGINASWAEPKDEPDDEVMQSVRTVYVRNLPTGSTDVEVRELFEKFGPIEKVVLPASTTGQKWKNFGFVYFEERSHALEAINAMNGHVLKDRALEVSLARPMDTNRPRAPAPGRGDRGENQRGDRHGGRGGHRGGRGQSDRGGSRYSDHYAPPSRHFDDYPQYNPRERERHEPYAMDSYPPRDRYPPSEYYPPPRAASPQSLDPYRGGALLPPPQQAQRPVYYSPATGQYVTTNAAGQLVPIDLAQARPHVDFSAPPPSYGAPRSSRYESRYEGIPPASPNSRYRPY